MNIRKFRNTVRHDFSAQSGFVICVSFFLFGVLTGAVSANYISADNTLALRNLFLDSNIWLFTGRGLFGTLFCSVIYHAFAVFLGFAVFGFALIPLLSGARGFLISFFTAALIRTLEKGGLIIALLRFGLPSLITLPCFFILSIQAFNASFDLTGKLLNRKSLRTVYDKHYFARCAYCFSALITAALIEAYVLPPIISFAASRL